ncbi:MAG: response regulator [Cyanobacteria bacterium P01_C01_bin.89]
MLLTLRELLAKRRRQGLSLRTIQIAPFAVQILAVVGFTGYAAYYTGQLAVDGVVERLRSEVTLRVENQLQYYLNAPQVLAEFTVDGFNLGNLRVEDPAGLTQQFWQLRDVLAPAEASAIYIGAENKEFIGLGFQDNQRWEVGRSGVSTGNRFFSYDTDEIGTPTDLVTQGKDYDPTQRPWYQKAKAAGKATWSDVYVDFKEKRLKITLARPLYGDQGNLEGVVGVDLVLSHIWTLLGQLDISPGAQTYIVDGDGLLVGMSAPDQPFVIDGEDVKRMAATEASVPLVQDTAKALQNLGTLRGAENSQAIATSITSPQQVDLNLDGELYFLQVAPVGQEMGLDWKIVVVIPQSDFTGQLAWTAWITVGVCVAAALGALGVGVVTSQWISQPVYQLEQAARGLAKGRWDAAVTVRSPRELAHLANSFHDMAAQLQASFDQLARKNAELQRLDKLKDEFLANTSHELRTPLNGSIGLLESFLEGSYGPITVRQKQTLEALLHSNCRLSALVDDILDFSSIQRGRFDLQVQPLSLREVLADVIAILKPVAEQKSLTLVNCIDEASHLPPVVADANRLQQILYNLLGNAIKFTHAGTVTIEAIFEGVGLEKSNGQDYPAHVDELEQAPPVEDVEIESAAKIRSGRVSHQLCIKITDTGIGIPESKRERIFEAFEQVDGSDSRQYSGVGLGLAIARQLVEAHEGRIEVDSTLGIGTTFSVWLPVAVGTEAVPLATVAGLRVSRPFVSLLGELSGELSGAINGVGSDAAIASIGSADRAIIQIEVTDGPSSIVLPVSESASEGLEGSEKPDVAHLAPLPGAHQPQILIVDDDPLNMQVLTERLEGSNYAIIQASSGDEALATVQQGCRPDLVLLDVMMPRMNGYEVAKQLRKQFSANEVPIVMLTAKNQLSDLALGLESGANDYLTKPVSREELLARLKTHLQLSNLNIAYNRFVPREFLELLQKDSIIDVGLGDRTKRTMSVLFSDIRGYTSLSEKMTPEANLQFINAYLAEMEDAIIQNQGFIDKYIGDAIMALFDKPADSALDAAIAMLRSLERHNAQRHLDNPENSDGPIRIGIGIDTGALMLGTVGGQRRLDTTVIGDAVNLASRLEELTKFYGVPLLISHRVLAELQEPERFSVRFLDRLSVRGRDQPVAIYEVLNADPENIRAQKLDTADRFEEAILLFHQRQYVEAAGLFEACLHHSPGDRAIEIYLERSVQLGSPPQNTSSEQSTVESSINTVETQA